MGAVSEQAPTLDRLRDVVVRLGTERRSEPVLQAVLDAARDLAGAQYAAIGVPDGDGGFALFLTAGVDAETWARIGSLPRTHGLLGALLETPGVIRSEDIRADPRFRGYPDGHPLMCSFLGVPIQAGGEIVAELYLASKVDGHAFDEEDQRQVEMLASFAALAVLTAQRTERLRELSVAAERTRIARDLHDSVTQQLFALRLATEAAVTVAGPDADPRLAGQLDEVRRLGESALEEMHALVETLRPPDVVRDGLAGALRKRVELLRAVHDVPVELRTKGPLRPCSRTVEQEVLKVAHEALANALRHADAGRVGVDLTGDGKTIRLEVTDDGRGFDLTETRRTTRRMGLASMRERAEAMSGTLRIDTAPAGGTTVVLEVPTGC
jgi:signal transduction histidine kinase